MGGRGNVDLVAISFVFPFGHTGDGMRRSGDVVRQLGLPTVVLQEGGYDVNALGANVQAWLSGLAF